MEVIVILYYISLVLEFLVSIPFEFSFPFPNFSSPFPQTLDPEQSRSVQKNYYSNFDCKSLSRITKKIYYSQNLENLFKNLN